MSRIEMDSIYLLWCMREDQPVRASVITGLTLLGEPRGGGGGGGGGERER